MGYDYFKNLLDKLPQNSFISIAYLNKQPQCGSFVLHNKEMAYYMFGASSDHAHNGAGTLLQWENLLMLKRIGVMKYSFVGYRFEVTDSKLANIQRFKERFGGELFNGYMFKCYLRPFKKMCFDLLCKITGVFSKDAIDQEKNKWKSRLEDNDNENRDTNLS